MRNLRKVHWFVSIIVFGWFICLHRWTITSIQSKKWIPAIYAEKTKQVRNPNLDEVWFCHEIHTESESLFDQHCCSKCIGHICNQHAQRSAWEEDKKEWLLLRIVHDLVTPFVTQRYKLYSLTRNFKTEIVTCGFVSDSDENTM